MNNQLKVSIVVPVYNMEKTIADTIENLRKQTYQNIEIIIVNDGSTDNTYNILEKYSNINSEVNIFHTKNYGSGPARNYGIKKASGKYIYFPDADDNLDRNAIEVLVNIAENEQSDLIVFGYKYIDQNGKILVNKNYKKLVCSGKNVRLNYQQYLDYLSDYCIQGAPWNKFFNLDIIKANNVVYPDLRRHQDEVFIARYIDKLERVTFIEENFYTYVVNDLSKEWDKYPLNYIEIIARLHQYRLDIIVKWNPLNTRVIQIIQEEYVREFIKALELSFSKKMQFNKKERKRWIINQIEKYSIEKICDLENIRQKYQNKVYGLIKAQSYQRLYIFLKIKVYFDKHLSAIKKIIKNC